MLNRICVLVISRLRTISLPPFILAARWKAFCDSVTIVTNDNNWKWFFVLRRRCVWLYLYYILYIFIYIIYNINIYLFFLLLPFFGKTLLSFVTIVTLSHAAMLFLFLKMLYAIYLQHHARFMLRTYSTKNFRNNCNVTLLVFRDAAIMNTSRMYIHKRMDVVAPGIA